MKILKLYNYNNKNKYARVTADVEIPCGFLWLDKKVATLKLHQNGSMFWKKMDGTYIDPVFGLKVDNAVESNMDRLLNKEAVFLT